MSKSGIRFMWKSKKRTGKQHIRGPDGQTLCLLERGGGRTDAVSDEPDPHRKIEPGRRSRSIFKPINDLKRPKREKI